MNAAPAFRLSVRPFGREPRSMTLHLHRIVGPEPVELDTKGRALKPLPTITLTELLAEVERVASGLGVPCRSAPEPVSWPVIEGRIVIPEKTT